MEKFVLWGMSVILAIIALAGVAMVVIFVFYNLIAPAGSFVLAQIKNFQNSENSKK